MASVAAGSGLSNYTISYEAGSLTVNPRTLSITANSGSKTYGQTRTYGAGSTAFSSIGLQNSESIGSVTITASGGAAANAAVGSYDLTPSAATAGTFNPNNYTISYHNGTLTVDPATLSITANNDTKTYGQTRTYGAGSTAFSSTGLQNSETIGSVTITASGGTAANAAAGSYDLTPSAATGGTFNPNNYTSTYHNGTLTVTKATLSVSASGDNKVYDGTTNATVTLSDNRLSGDVLTITYTNASFADKDVETNKTISVSGIAISGSAAANYQLTSMTATTSADITPASLTVSGDDQSRSYGAANPTLTASLSGFVGGEDSSVLGGALAISTTADTSSPVGNYPIQVSGLTASNYSITFSNGTLAVTAKALTITANDASKTYGQTISFAGTEFSTDGLINSDTVSSVSLASSGAAVSAPVGSYDIVPSAASGSGVSNYSISYHNGSLTVGRATVIASITAENKVYDGAASATIAGGSLSGVVGGDNVALSGGTASLVDQHAGNGKTVTVTGLGLSGTTAGNYLLASSTATAT